MRFALPLFALALVACEPPVTMVTDAGACQSPIAPNLLVNPSFECGASAPTHWTPIYGALSTAVGEGRSGNAAKVTVEQLGGRFAYEGNAVTDGGTRTFCASAYVKGDVPFMNVMIIDETGQSAGFASPVTSTWQRVPPSINVTMHNNGAKTLTLFFEAQKGRADGMNAMVGQTMLIDDVDLWESASGFCDDHP